MSKRITKLRALVALGEVLVLKGDFRRHGDDVSAEKLGEIADALRGIIGEEGNAPYTIKIDDHGTSFVFKGDDEVEVPDDVFDVVDYRIVEVEDEIEIIAGFICEAKSPLASNNRSADVPLMEAYLALLKQMDVVGVEFAFNSLSDNALICWEDNPKKFEEICERILDEVEG